ncbi:MAG: DUF1289 domain-containing protein [Rhodoferax sp.]|nr:DUF1289 domain-containing protein [Rhodoferax sp.]
MCGSEVVNLPEGVQRVAAVLQSHAHPHAPVMLEDAARTAQQAADALGVALGQIAKSIIFRRLADDKAVLVVTSGDRRVDQKRVEKQTGPLGRADAAFVKASTGFSIGGVAPIAHANACVTLIDEDLFRFDDIWAAAGHPHSVFQLTPNQLCQMTGVMESGVVEMPLANMPPGARKVLSDRSASVQAAGKSSMSPCVSVCRMDATQDACLGCLRTRDELTAWSTMDEDAKFAVWTAIDKRLQGRMA